MSSDIDVDLELKRARRCSSNGRFKRARAHYEVVLSQQPENVRVICSIVQIDAELGRISFDNALAKIEELIAVHPSDDRLPTSLVSILWRMGRKEESAEARRAYFEQFPDSPAALQFWANGLQIDPERKDRPDTQATAWGFYKQALASGPLLTPCFKSVAYSAAKQADPENANDALQGSGILERMAIRTRGLGPSKMMLALVAGAGVAELTLRTAFALSIVVQTLTLSWGVWCIFSNNLMCCKKCRNSWIFMVSYLTLLGAAFDHPKSWYVPASIAVVVIVWTALTGKLRLVWPNTKVADNEEVIR